MRHAARKQRKIPMVPRLGAFLAVSLLGSAVTVLGALAVAYVLSDSLLDILTLISTEL